MEKPKRLACPLVAFFMAILMAVPVDTEKFQYDARDLFLDRIFDGNMAKHLTCPWVDMI